MKQKEIPDYLTDRFWSAYNIWNNTRLTGSLPFSNKGWAEHPTHLIEIITIMQQEYNTIIREYDKGLM